MSARIKAMYHKAGMKAPDGKGIHTRAFHECVISVTKGGGAKNPHAVCMAQLGPAKAVHKEHRRGISGAGNPHPKKKDSY